MPPPMSRGSWRCCANSAARRLSHHAIGPWCCSPRAASTLARHSCAWSARAPAHAPQSLRALPRCQPHPPDSTARDVLTPQTVLRVLGITATVLFSGFAAAQVGGSVIVESDYRFRGISLSGGDPTAHLNLAYDHASGWYTGASLAGTELKPGSRKTALTAYLGYASRRGDLGAWEAGAVLNRFFGLTYYDYDEVYAGFIAERWTARVYYSPDYFGRS